MALTQTQAQMRAALRKFCNVQGATALLRHPDADCNDNLNRGLARLRYLLSQSVPDQRFLGTFAITTAKGVSTYPINADFSSLISVDLTAAGRKVWLESYEMHERPDLTTPDVSYAGIPFCYRLRGGNIEFLPVPGAAYPATLWYVNDATQLASDPETIDTVNRLDDYVIAYAARFIATKDKNWDLLGECKALMGELEGEIQFLGRSRDQNSSSRIVDVYRADRWGRTHWRRGYR